METGGGEIGASEGQQMGSKAKIGENIVRCALGLLECKEINSKKDILAWTLDSSPRKICNLVIEQQLYFLFHLFLMLSL